MLSPLAWTRAAWRCFLREIREWSFGEFFFCAIMPFFWMLVVWALLGQGVITDVPVGFVDEDKSHISREVARAIDANRAFGLVHFESGEAAMAAMRGGSLYGVINIPFGYSRAMLDGRGSSVILYVDESRYAVAGSIQAEMSSVMRALESEGKFAAALRLGNGTAGASRIVELTHSDFYALGNMEFSFLAFLGAALMPGVIMVGAMMGFVTSILREEWRNGTGNWLASAKGSASAALAGKLLPHYGLYCFVFLFYMALFCGYGGFYPAGSLFLWFMCGASCLAVFAAMAVLIAAIAPNWRFALIFASGYAAPALPFTGFSIPLESMGEYARAFAQCLPLTWLVQGQAQQWTLGADLADMKRTFTAFALLFIIPAIVGLALFRLRLAGTMRKVRAR